MIVVDSSALIAILFGEPSASALITRMAEDPDRIISAASYLESGTVLAGRRRSDRLRAISDLDAFMDQAGLRIEPVDERQVRLALRARIVYGRGMGHGGALNFGDAFSYALAKSRNVPLLYVGEDFAATDVVPALRAP